MQRKVSSGFPAHMQPKSFGFGFRLRLRVVVIVVDYSLRSEVAKMWMDLEAAALLETPVKTAGFIIFLWGSKDWLLFGFCCIRTWGSKLNKISETFLVLKKSRNQIMQGFWGKGPLKGFGVRF